MAEGAFCPVVRRRIYYILICGVSSQPILTLCMGDNSSELKTYNPSNQLQWLINFSSEVQARGDVVRVRGLVQLHNTTDAVKALLLIQYCMFFFQIFLLLAGETGQIRAGCATNEPRSLTLGLSALFVAFLWMLLPYIAVCAVICLFWKVQQQIHGALQSQKRSE